VRGFAARAKTAHFHACGDDDEKAKRWPPKGSPEEAKSGRLVASDKSLRVSRRSRAAASIQEEVLGLRHAHTHTHTYNNASPLCSFIIIMVVPAVSINAIQAAVQLRRPLTHSLLSQY
jgi:hypothetical protein